MKKYYSLQSAGRQLLNADNPLRIGQTDCCEMKLHNNSKYEDAEIAVIEPCGDNRGWKLVRLSPYKEHEVRVNGVTIDYVCFLKDGDRIAIEGQKQDLLFRVYDDGLYTSNGIVMAAKNKASRPLMIWMLLLTAVIAVFAIRYYYTRPITPAMMDKARQSVYQIRVDSVKLLSYNEGQTTVLGACAENTAGLAFLTDDSLFVTARHCIEPWLNVNDTVSMDLERETMPLPVRWALMAETANQSDTGEKLEVVSVCSVYQMQPEYKFLFRVESSDFMMDKSRDHIVEYGDYNHQYFWRSISWRPRRVDMMMGDIAFMRVTSDMPLNPKGTIRLAGKKEFSRLTGLSKTVISAMGCPKVGVGKAEMEYSEGVLKKRIQLGEDGYPEYVISHDGGILQGYSGSPVLTKIGFKWYAIGVVSVTDKYVKTRFYAVPVTEIEKQR